MPMAGPEIERRIREAIPDAQIVLNDLAGDDDHWEVTVASASFAGLGRVAQHQRVYRAIGQEMGHGLHALAVRTRLPE